ncbi:MAG: cytochrome c biogenesis protein ResB, partial [Holophagae bacterium]|nr:cytochrome c biogenesis protein ResB [Holophagae bacterium]
MRKKSLAFYLAVTGLITVYLLILQIAANLNKPVFYGLVAALALFIIFVTARKPRNVLDFFRSPKLAASVLVYFTIAVVIGTLILQNVEPAQYLQLYSPGFYKFVKLVALDDAYHSVWFSGLV